MSNTVYKYESNSVTHKFWATHATHADHASAVDTTTRRTRLATPTHPTPSVDGQPRRPPPTPTPHLAPQSPHPTHAPHRTGDPRAFAVDRRAHRAEGATPRYPTPRIDA